MWIHSYVVFYWLSFFWFAHHCFMTGMKKVPDELLKRLYSAMQLAFHADFLRGSSRIEVAM